MLCPKCRAENPEPSTKCLACGAYLTAGYTSAVALNPKPNKPNPLWPTTVSFLLGGPITAVMAYFVWKTSWSKAHKLLFIVGLSVLINVLLLALIGWLAGSFLGNADSAGSLTGVTDIINMYKFSP